MYNKQQIITKQQQQLLLHPFNGLFSRTTWASQYQRQNQSGFKWSKRLWGFGMKWHQLDHMQTICTSLQTDNQASTPPLSFLQAGCLPAAQPTASNHWRHMLYEENNLLSQRWKIGKVLGINCSLPSRHLVLLPRPRPRPPPPPRSSEYDSEPPLQQHHTPHSHYITLLLTVC